MRSTGPLYSMSPIFFKKTSQNGAAKWRMDSRDHFYWFCTNINAGLWWSCTPRVLDVCQDGIQMPLHQYWVRCRQLSLFLLMDDLVLEISSSKGQWRLFCDWVLANKMKELPKQTWELYLGCNNTKTMLVYADFYLTFGLKIFLISPLFLRDHNGIKQRFKRIDILLRKKDPSNLTLDSKESLTMSKTPLWLKMSTSTVYCSEGDFQDSQESWWSSQWSVI